MPDGQPSVTNDAVTRFTGHARTRSSRSSERALSWCRDIQQGRSFYTGMGQTVGAYDATLSKHLGVRRPVGGGHGPRRLQGDDQLELHADAPDAVEPDGPGAADAARATANFNPYMGEIDALAMADDGRVFYAGRAVCFQGQQQFTQWTHPQTGLGCGPIHVCDPRGAGSFDQNPTRITKVADFTVLGAKGGGDETGATAKTEHGILGIALDPQFGVAGANRIHLRRLPPVLRRHDGPQHGHEHGPGLRPRRLHGRAPPLALHLQRDDQDAAATSGSSTAS